MTDLSTRAATQADLGALVELNAEVQALHFESRPDQFKPVNRAAIERWLAEHLQDPAARVWVAEAEPLVVGYAVVKRRDWPGGPFVHTRVWWDLDQIGVRSTHRKSGVARALVEKVVAEAKANAITELELNSWAFNHTAQEAFRSLGFVPKATRFELLIPRESPEEPSSD
jgi:ribosomal protein S18 acetylase RimI-like enzyme